jgi:hypothetical protein
MHQFPILFVADDFIAGIAQPLQFGIVDADDRALTID